MVYKIRQSLMKSPQPNTFSVLTGIAFILGASGISLAQTEPEEELEIIEIGDGYTGDEAATDDDFLRPDSFRIATLIQ